MTSWSNRLVTYNMDSSAMGKDSIIIGKRLVGKVIHRLDGISSGEGRCCVLVLERGAVIGQLVGVFMEASVHHFSSPVQHCPTCVLGNECFLCQTQ